MRYGQKVRCVIGSVSVVCHCGCSGKQAFHAGHRCRPWRQRRRGAGQVLERKEHQPQRGAGLRALCGAQLPRRQGDIHTQDRRLRDPARTGQHCQPQQGRPVCVDSYQRPAQGKDCPGHGDIHPGNAPRGRQPRRGKARELGDIVRRQLQAALRGVRPSFV